MEQHRRYDWPVAAEALLETSFQAWGEGGGLVVNAVTVGSELKVLRHDRDGGELIGIGIQRVGAIGSFHGGKPLAPVTQWSIIKT